MPATEKPRGSNYTPPRGTRTIKSVAFAMEECRVAGNLALLKALAEAFFERRMLGGVRCPSFSRHETKVLDRVDAAVAVAEARGLAPDAPLDPAFWARVDYLADACWEGEIRTRAVEHVLEDEALDYTSEQS